MEAITNTAFLVNQELLKVPCDVVDADRIVDQLVTFADLDNSLWASIFHELIKWMMISTVDFNFAKNVQVSVWLPAITYK